MDEKELLKELGKIISLEYGHLGMYRNFSDFKDKEIKRTFRTFMEIELEHINKLEGIIKNLKTPPPIIIESGDIIGNFFGISLKKIASEKDLLKAYSFIEKKSHEGYSKFVEKLDSSNNKLNDFIAEIVASNLLESKLMHLWFEDKLSKME